MKTFSLMRYVFFAVSLIMVFLLLKEFNDDESNQFKVTKNRPEAFLDGYAEYLLLSFDEVNLDTIVNIPFHQKHTVKNTHEVVSRMVVSLQGKNTLNAFANVFEKNEGGYQCIIVHKPNVHPSVLDHELGHCFKRLFLDTLKSSEPRLRKNYLGNDKYSVYIGESFAEMVATSRAYFLDGDFSYLVSRLAQIQAKASYLNQYKAAIPLLLSQREFMQNSDEIPSNAEAQIKYLINHFYIEHVLSREDFENRRWWKEWK